MENSTCPEVIEDTGQERLIWTLALGDVTSMPSPNHWTCSTTTSSQWDNEFIVSVLCVLLGYKNQLQNINESTLNQNTNMRIFTLLKWSFKDGFILTDLIFHPHHENHEKKINIKLISFKKHVKTKNKFQYPQAISRTKNNSQFWGNHPRTKAENVSLIHTCGFFFFKKTDFTAHCYCSYICGNSSWWRRKENSTEPSTYAKRGANTTHMSEQCHWKIRFVF